MGTTDRISAEDGQGQGQTQTTGTMSEDVTTAGPVTVHDLGLRAGVNGEEVEIDEGAMSHLKPYEETTIVPAVVRNRGGSKGAAADRDPHIPADDSEMSDDELTACVKDFKRTVNSCCTHHRRSDSF